MKLVPGNHDISQEEYDGLFISNGPGDPSLAQDAVLNLRKVCTTTYYTTNYIFTVDKILDTWTHIAQISNTRGLSTSSYVASIW